jgi:hypothetical protein
MVQAKQEDDLNPHKPCSFFPLPDLRDPYTTNHEVLHYVKCKFFTTLTANKTGKPGNNEDFIFN